MSTEMRSVKRAAIVLYLLAVHAALIYLAVEKFRPVVSGPTMPPPSAVPDLASSTPVPTPITDPTVFYDAPPEEPNPAAPLVTPTVPPPQAELIVPVAGVRPDQLVDSFSDARSEGRVHDAIDIMAPGGTPVLAAADGEIARFFDSEKGGITIYQFSPDKRFVYYYAHLQRRADDLKPGDPVARGRTIGYVGDTGNAGPGNFHLHFSISAVNDPNRYWEGTPINPFPLLKSGSLPR